MSSQQRKYATPSSAFRSGLEEKAKEQIEAAGLVCHYEKLKLPFTQPAKARHYTPDFILPNGVIIETKGLFQTDDKQKHLMVKSQHPDLDIRFVFSNAQKTMSKVSGVTYAMWAAKNGYLWAHKRIPDEWLSEEPNEASLNALSALGFNPRTCP